jgi:hypothetical protein
VPCHLMTAVSIIMFLKMFFFFFQKKKKKRKEKKRKKLPMILLGSFIIEMAHFKWEQMFFSKKSADVHLLILQISLEIDL